MKASSSKRILPYLFILLIINLVSVFLVPVTDDEAYYWMYAQFPDWGYFDHPPMVGLMIWIGDQLFGGVLGIRLMTVLLSNLTMGGLWLLVPKDHKISQEAPFLFFLLSLSIPIFNMYGFITTPDVPLLFFSVMYLHVFNRFCLKQDLKKAILLGIIAALLMYSKYHGALVILFTLMANIRLLKNVYIYLAGIIGAALFVPHILWQVEHEFVTFGYHLVDRSENVIRIGNIFEYFLNVFLVLNPAMVIILLIQWKNGAFKTISSTYKWLFIGVTAVFTISSLKGHVEPHWVAINAIPLLLMVFHLIKEKLTIANAVKKTIYVSAGLMLVTRILIAFPLFKIQGIDYSAETYYQTVQNHAEGMNVGFVNSYQKASLYAFHTGQPSISYNTSDYRKNQYDLWPLHEAFHLKPLVLIGNWPSGYFDSISGPNDDEIILIDTVPKFQFVSNMKMDIETSLLLHKNKKETFSVRIVNPYPYRVNFTEKDVQLAPLIYLMNDSVEKPFYYSLKDIESINGQSIMDVSGVINIKDSMLTAGTYTYLPCLKVGYLYDIVIGRPGKIELLNE